MRGETEGRIYSGRPGIQRPSKTELEVTLFTYCSLEVYLNCFLGNFLPARLHVKNINRFFCASNSRWPIASGRPDFHIYFDYIHMRICAL